MIEPRLRAQSLRTLAEIDTRIGRKISKASSHKINWPKQADCNLMSGCDVQLAGLRFGLSSASSCPAYLIISSLGKRATRAQRHGRRRMMMNARRKSVDRASEFEFELELELEPELTCSVSKSELNFRVI